MFRLGLLISFKKLPKKKRKQIRLLRDALYSSCLSLVTLGIISTLFISTSYFNPIAHALKDFSFLDAYYQAKFKGQGSISPNLVLINIGDMNRDEIVQLIQKIQGKQPAVLGLDILFDKKSHSKNDSLLFKVISKENMVLPYILYKDSTNFYGAVTPKNRNWGFVNLTGKGATGIIRSFQGVITNHEERWYALSSQMMRQYKSGIIWQQNDFESKLSKARRIKFYGHFQDFPHYEGKSILDNGVLPNLKEKMVLMGYAGAPPQNPYDIEDKHFTPLNTHPLGKGTPDMYGITIHANLINMMLQNDFFHELGRFGKWFLIFMLSYLASLYFIWLDRRLKISYRTVRKLVLFVFAFIFVGLCLWLFGKNMVIEPTLAITITMFSAGFVKYYKHLVRYIKSKRNFKSYIK
jgi:CHASE2 domain-containing sensor protein